jgi:hypothetical protein
MRALVAGHIRARTLAGTEAFQQPRRERKNVHVTGHFAHNGDPGGFDAGSGCVSFRMDDLQSCAVPIRCRLIRSGGVAYNNVGSGEIRSTRRSSVRHVLLSHLLLAIATISALGIFAVARPVAAAEFPYCIQGYWTGYPGDCQYRSYDECSVTASGRGYCGANPAYVASQSAPHPDAHVRGAAAGKRH